MTSPAVSDLLQRLAEDNRQRIDRERDVENSVRDTNLRLDAELHRIDQRFTAFEREQRELFGTLIKTVQHVTDSSKKEVSN